jgi:two-component system phosphate regulon sensor histidine kinase PhoR
VTSSPWIGELGRAAAFALAGLGLGLPLGQPVLALWLATLVYLVLHLRQLARLERWLRLERKKDPPVRSGVWGEVFQYLQRLQQRHRRRKKKLSNLLQRYRESTSALPDATVVLDPDGDIEWFNEAAARLLGLRHPQDLGQHIGALVRSPEFLDYLEAGEPRPEEPLEMPSPEDDRVRLAVRVIRFGKSQRLLIARDVTGLHRLEQLRRDFVANVSHELRTPLTVVTGYLETLAGSMPEMPHSQARALVVMREQAARMGRLIDDLLLLARLEASVAAASMSEEVSVPALLRAVLDEARVVSAGRHAITAEIDAALGLLGDARELRSAFANLVQNAVRYTPAGGRIRVRWQRGAAGGHLEVQDTGIGIPADHLPRLTERFYRVDTGRSREAGGTGLGLAIVKHVLGRHGADLTIDSEPGRGSTFGCDFPSARLVPVPVPEPEVGGAPAERQDDVA